MSDSAGGRLARGFDAGLEVGAVAVEALRITKRSLLAQRVEGFVELTLDRGKRVLVLGGESTDRTTGALKELGAVLGQLGDEPLGGGNVGRQLGIHRTSLSD